MKEQEDHLRHVLLIYRRMIPSIRLCGHCQLEYLAQQGRLRYRAVQEMMLSTSDLDWADTVLLGRLDSWYEHQLVMKLREARKRLIYIIDDDLLGVPSQINSAAYYGQRKIRKYIREMIEMSDVILSPSSLLLQKYAVDGRGAIQIEEPAIGSVCYFPHRLAGPVKIGFAGSIDRIGDVDSILREVLFQIKEIYGDRVELEFFGAIPPFANKLSAKCIPYCNSYEKYRKTLNDLQWDVGLAPMPDTPFHACKHYNKFVEYAAAGAVGVFSKVEPYTSIQKFYPSVLLCENDARAWKRTLCELIENREFRERLRAEAVEIAETRFSVERSAQVLEKALCSPNDVQNYGRTKYGLVSRKLIGCLLRGWGYVKKCALRR